MFAFVFEMLVWCVSRVNGPSKTIIHDRSPASYDRRPALNIQIEPSKAAMSVIFAFLSLMLGKEPMSLSLYFDIFPFYERPVWRIIIILLLFNRAITSPVRVYLRHQFWRTGES